MVRYPNQFTRKPHIFLPRRNLRARKDSSFQEHDFDRSPATTLDSSTSDTHEPMLITSVIVPYPY